jgi:hypothetical protein
MHSVKSTTPPVISNSKYGKNLDSDIPLDAKELKDLSKINPRGTFKLNGKDCGLTGAYLNFVNFYLILFEDVLPLTCSASSYYVLILWF